MKVEPHMAPVRELDFVAISAVIVLELARLLNRIDEDCRRAPDRAHRSYEVPRGYPRDLCGDFRQACDRQMAEDAVKAKRKVDRGIGFRQLACKI